MKTLEYFQYRNIYMVCYVPLRINFAAYTRIVLEQLQFNSKDAIVLPHPAHSAIQFKISLRILPRKPSVIKSVNRANGNIAIIPVSNNDAATEAARYAIENKITLEYSGGYVPANISDHRWQEFYPDDSILLEAGISAWYESVKNQIEKPAYTMSEKYDIDKIFETSYIYKKVFMPVPVQDFEELKKLLPDEEYDFGESQHQSQYSAEYELHIDETFDQETKINLLDSIPGLSEVYEKYRDEGQVASFSKWNALLRIMHETEAEWKDMNFSMHHYLAFSQITCNMQSMKNNPFLTVDSIFTCIETTFNKTFAYRVKEKLLNYFEKKIHSVTPPGEAGRYGGNYDNISWPGYKKLIADMMEKLHKQACQAAETTYEILPFKGSMKRGIHIKKTLTNFFKGKEDFFVKDQKITRIFLDNKEPVVFINRDYNNIAQYCDFCCIWVGKKRGEQYTANWQYGYMERVENVRVKDFSIYKYGFKGLVFFCDPLRHTEKLKAQYENDEEFYNRVPLRRQHDPLLSQLERDVYKSKISWDEAMFTSAIKFSKKAVILIAPLHYTLPPSVHSLFTKQKKILVRLTENALSPDEVRRIYNADLSVSGPHDPPHGDDRNDVQSLLDLESRFSEVINVLW